MPKRRPRKGGSRSGRGPTGRIAAEEEVEIRTRLPEPAYELVHEARAADARLAFDQDPAAEEPSLWRGLNLLGFALMEVRAQLQE